ncbi:putative F-box/FBD/LRR-repeat protein At1g78760 [Medicago truncatula]|uniref:putative F-box/FBD/LRR-repeat protein At1g78760 n=1 Tax=Medicago truncatula TaxID=3880 RepID=UPI00196756F3|nr:putative F-box/FBD/LRR-repeat protein At1g78760 [Medicago truncatula]
MRREFITAEENIILERTKKRRQYANEVIEDRLSDLPDGVILQILSLLDTKQVVRTCVLSKRWEHLWKRISTLILHSSRFSYVKQFTTFVSKILTLRDSSTALRVLDVDRNGNFEPRLLKRILNYISSHSTHLQELAISVRGDTSLILNCFSSCRALTSLKLSIYPRDGYTETLFPNSLNLPLLTSLDITNFAFCGGESGCAEPFSVFTMLNSLALSSCKVKDAQILTISSDTLANLAIHSPFEEINVDIHDNSSNMPKIELSTPSLYTFTYYGSLIQEICGSGLSSVKQVHIDDSREFSASVRHGLLVFNWLLDFANVESLALSSTTLQILSLVPDLLEVKLPSLCNLKSLEVELVPFIHRDGFLFRSIEAAMLKKAAAKSRKEVAKLRKAFKARLEPRAIPDGMVDFLRQNSPSAEVNITTDFSHVLNPKQVAESIKGAKIISYRSRFSKRLSPVPFHAAPASGTEYDSATALASVSVTAPDAVPASAAPPNLHLCRDEKDDKSSNEDEVEKRQPNTDSPLLDNGQ